MSERLRVTKTNGNGYRLDLEDFAESILSIACENMYDTLNKKLA